jgi:hypothetical protein
MLCGKVHFRGKEGGKTLLPSSCQSLEGLPKASRTSQSKANVPHHLTINFGSKSGKKDGWIIEFPLA